MIAILEIALLWLAICLAAGIVYLAILRSRRFNRTVETLTSDDEAVVERLEAAEVLVEARAEKAEETAHRERHRAKQLRRTLKPRRNTHGT